MTFRRLRIEGGFVLLLALLVYLDKGGFLWVVWTAALLHEGGHWTAIKLAGGRIERVTRSAGGVSMVQANRPRLSYRGELWSVLAGPLASLCAALTLAWLGQAPALCGMCLCHGLFNLLPVSGLDGGRVLELALASRGRHATAERILRATRTAAPALLLVLGVCLLVKTGGNASLLLAAAYVWVNANPRRKPARGL